MIVWQKSLLLIKEVYGLTGNFPANEKYGLTSQLRRAAVSVLSNISEGEARRTLKEKIRFYEIARASLVEIDAQIEISLALELISRKDIYHLSGLSNECIAMLSKLMQSR